VVNRGVWSVGDEEREVAVKSLADDSTEDKRIQFLQEAAIQRRPSKSLTFHQTNVSVLFAIYNIIIQEFPLPPSHTPA